MPKERYNTEQIIHKLSEADVLLGSEYTVCQRIGVADLKVDKLILKEVGEGKC